MFHPKLPSKNYTYHSSLYPSHLRLIKAVALTLDASHLKNSLKLPCISIIPGFSCEKEPGACGRQASGESIKATPEEIYETAWMKMKMTDLHAKFCFPQRRLQGPPQFYNSHGKSPQFLKKVSNALAGRL